MLIYSNLFTMSHTKCCVPGCENSAGSHVTLHKFPNPEKDLALFNVWVSAIGGHILELDNNHTFKYRRVCHLHFEEKYWCRNNRISKIAVPTLNMSGSSSYEEYTGEQQSFRKPETSVSKIKCVQLNLEDSLSTENNGNQQPIQDEYSSTGYIPPYGALDYETVIETSEPVIKTGEIESNSEECRASSTHDPLPPDAKQGQESDLISTPPCPEEPPRMEVDPKILKALGEVTNTSPQFGEPIHNNLVQLWSPLLKKGLSKESKEAIYKEHRIPENCKLLQAPKLNAEIMAAISDLARNRDKKRSTSQEQLGIGISAISRALTILLSNQNDKIKTIKYLSDGCMLLCDLHFNETACRTKLVTPNLDASFCKLMQGVERDETLFGEKLSEKIKASKAISRQRHQIKKPAKRRLQLSTGRPNNTQGNWSGPLRSSARWGRGGRPYNNAVTNNSRVSPLPPQHQLQSQPSPSKPRA